MNLRPYQSRAIEMLYDWFRANPTGNPVLNMPGGSGKSVVIASIVKDALTSWPKTRVLMLVHSRELVAQNAAKLRAIWPGAPMGVYSASLGKRQLGEPITYAGIQSVRNLAKTIGHIDLCLCDEAHAISNTETGTYRKFLADLLEINPAMRVVGFSASPYRLGAGMITDGEDALFADILEPVSIEELVYHGHLVPLRSKVTDTKLDADGVAKRQGDYVASQMQEKFDTKDNNENIAIELIDKAKDRKHWLIFCSGIEHARHFAQELQRRSIAADHLTGHDSTAERDRKLKAFESGEIRALCNVGILTTGYDFPALDCVVFLRATMSPGLYLQMAVRGMRPHPNKLDCLVLDFAGVVSAHGPITAIKPPKQGGKGGDAPVRICPECAELCHPTLSHCPACGHEFPPPEEKPMYLRNDDIMGGANADLSVTSWRWRKHVGRTSGKAMLRVDYYGALSDEPVQEYMTVLHDGYPGNKAIMKMVDIIQRSGAPIRTSDPFTDENLDDIALILNEAKPPSLVSYKKNGKFKEVLTRQWSADE